MPDPDDNPPLAQPALGVHPLTYRSAGAVPPRAGLVTVGSLLNVDTARLVMAVLEAEGIESHLFNESSQALGIGAFGYTASEIQVPSLDAERAKAIVRQLIEDPDAVEPAEVTDSEAPQGDDGQELVVVGAYDHPRSLQEAAAVLGSARIKPYLPGLVARGPNPAGTGDRFLLRAEAEEAERARSILEDAREESEEDAKERGLLRCPKCNRLTGERISRGWDLFTALLTVRPPPSPRGHCAPCRHYRDIKE
jgi:hypothetical protein